MGHCKDCKYWAKKEGFAGRVCLRAGTPGALMVVDELCEYSHGPQLVTEPSFGCAMFCAPATHCPQCRSKLRSLRVGTDRAHDQEFCSQECVDAWAEQATCLPGTILGHLKDGTPVYFVREP
jgi:hypothetical protein